MTDLISAKDARKLIKSKPRRQRRELIKSCIERLDKLIKSKIEEDSTCLVIEWHPYDVFGRDSDICAIELDEVQEDVIKRLKQEKYDVEVITKSRHCEPVDYLRIDWAGTGSGDESSRSSCD